MSSAALQLFASGPWAAPLTAALPDLRPVVVEGLADLPSEPGRAAVLVLDAGLLAGDDVLEALAALSEATVVLAADPRAAAAAEGAGRLFLALPEGGASEAWRGPLRAASLHAESLAGAWRLRREGALAARDLASLSEIGEALLRASDLPELLHAILGEARRITASDAGSLFLVDDDRLRFRLTQNDSLPGLAQPDFAIPLDGTSLAGYAATTGETLRLDDVYALPPDAPYRFDRRFDEANGYRTGAVLAVPLRTPGGETLGVLQLLNPAGGCYGERDQRLARAFGGQAAVALENQRLREDIEALFEGFIRASVTAIDQRDPGTSGHSERVAELTCELARRVDAATLGELGTVRFGREALRELRYAALLHDFGKVFVPERVLGKQRKLTPEREALVGARFEQAVEVLEAQVQRERARYLMECGDAGFDLFEKDLLRHQEAERGRLYRFQEAVLRANEPRVLPDDAEEALQHAAEHRVVGAEGRVIRLLEEEDLACLSVPQGSLTPDERRAIQDHVTYTQRFLAQIPWTRDLARVEAIAGGHHEKLDGSGYPHGLAGEAIGLETRILTIADIFDALTAADRPYKKALPREKALEILHGEAERGRVDATLLEVFCGASVWEVLSGRSAGA